jgi:dTDP-glucose 4,6-dehydratase
MRLLVTGGAGFIGSAFVRLALNGRWASRLTNLDKLTYAGNLENLAEVERDPAYRFVQGDINDSQLVMRLIEEERPDAIVHFAAESHVDRSILGPGAFFETNLRGTFTLLEAARAVGVGRFLHVSTDEVYGSIDEPHDADEGYPLKPSSPYSASKAGSDLLALSYWTTYRMPVTVTRASNNYGPYQFPEKLIPLMITNAMDDKALPIYGDGMQVRDWLYVDDHCRAIRAALVKGAPGEIYNVGGSRALPNRDVVEMILDAMGKPHSLMTTVKDRPGHDRRYAITTEKLERATGWRAEVDFETGLRQTIEWYRANGEWSARVKSGAYQEYYERNYAGR